MVSRSRSVGQACWSRTTGPYWPRFGARFGGCETRASTPPYCRPRRPPRRSAHDSWSCRDRCRRRARRRQRRAWITDQPRARQCRRSSTPGRVIADHRGAVPIGGGSAARRPRCRVGFNAVQVVIRTVHIAGSRTGSAKRSDLRHPVAARTLPCRMGTQIADTGAWGPPSSTRRPGATPRCRVTRLRRRAPRDAPTPRPWAGRCGFDRVSGVSALVIRCRSPGRTRAPAALRRGGQL